MITGELKSKVDSIWNTMWSGGISNPLSVIEQLTYLLFIKRLDELHTLKEAKAARTAEPTPDIAFHIFRDAFSPTAAVGGFTGATVTQGIRFGIARGVFSNESGLGSGAIAAAAARAHHPVAQGLVSMTQTFIDTIVVCSITGFTIIATGAWQSGDTGAALTTRAFSTGLPGTWGGSIVALALALFAWCFRHQVLVKRA